jgi:hypothetical protein
MINIIYLYVILLGLTISEAVEFINILPCECEINNIIETDGYDYNTVDDQNFGKC